MTVRASERWFCGGLLAVGGCRRRGRGQGRGHSPRCRGGRRGLLVADVALGLDLGVLADVAEQEVLEELGYAVAGLGLAEGEGAGLAHSLGVAVVGAVGGGGGWRAQVCG